MEKGGAALLVLGTAFRLAPSADAWADVHTGKEGVSVSCITAHDQQLARLANAIAQRVGQQRFHVWFNNSTRLDLKQDGLEIAVPNDFISEWIGSHFSGPIQEAAHEVLGCSLAVRFSVVPQLFEVQTTDDTPAPKMPEMKTKDAAKVSVRSVATTAMATPVHPVPAQRLGVEKANGHPRGEADCVAIPVMANPPAVSTATIAVQDRALAPSARPRLRHEIETFVVGQSNQLAYNTAL